MVNNLTEVSAGVLALSASFLLLHHVTPPRTAKRRSSMRSPFGFMNYLLFHQVARPNRTMASGKIKILSQDTILSVFDVRLSGRSSGDLGLMLIRSSSALSRSEERRVGKEC